MKCRYPSSNSCSSSSSSSCIESQNINGGVDEITKRSPQHKKPKRVRAKRTQSSATSSSKSRSSMYRGVTRHRWTGRYEAHLWDKTTWNSVQNKKGRQIYLGAYDNEEDAARTYDLAAIKYWGDSTTLNFPPETYIGEREKMGRLTKEEFLATLRRQSSGFSRGISKYRGVARHHHNGRWEARIGNVSGNKYLYLGTYSTQEEAAVAYDMAAIEFRGLNAVTNFDINNYTDKLNKIPPEQQDSPGKQENTGSPDDDDDKLRVGKAIDQYHQEDGNQVIMMQPLVSKIDSVNSNDQFQDVTTTMIEHEHEHKHPWDVFLDIGINSSFPSLDMIPLHKAYGLQGLFDDNGFEENIECIFDGSFDDYEHNVVADDVSVVQEVKGKGLSTSSSNSSLSTDTSICRNS